MSAASSLVKNNLSKSSAFEKCARLLFLNDPTNITDFCETIEKVIGNIIDNPNEQKFKTLKTDNKFVANKILSKTGGLEFMVAIGFTVEKDADGKKCLTLSTLALLESGLQWLRNTSSVCLEFAADKFDKSTPYCCECVIQIRLPTGVSINGGFMRGDTLQDVKQFALSYFQENRSNQIQIMIPPSTRNATDEELHFSLEQLNMTPRAIVIISTITDADKSIVIEKAHSQGIVVEDKILFDESAAKKKKDVERVSIQKDREKVLAAFKEDRSKKPSNK